MVLKEEDIKRLEIAAKDASKQAYCPYSKYRVGAALLTTNGHVISGCNVENASYGLTICAERTAIVKFISELADKDEKIIAIAVYAPDGSGDAAPCGACRQFLVEFNPNMMVYSVPSSSLSASKSWLASELLPIHFGPNSLEQKGSSTK